MKKSSESFQIRPGLHRIEGKLSNLYLFKPQRSEPEFILIDTGLAEDFQTFSNYMESIKTPLNQIDRIILTNADMDHAGGAERIRKETNAEVFIHPRGREELKKQDNSRKVKMAARAIQFQIYNSVKNVSVIKSGEKIGPLKVLSAVGYSPGTIILHETDNNLLFSGDTIRTDLRGNPMFLSSNQVKDLSQARRSLKEIAQLKFDSLFPGHGNPLTEKAGNKIRNLVELM